MLSKKAKYGLKALVYLAQKDNKQEVTLIQEIAQEARIPKKFLEQILLLLKSRGVVNSKRGKEGGYFLVANIKELMIGDVVRIIDGPLAPIPCASKTAFMPCEECVDVKSCEIRWVMGNVRDAISNVLDNTSLEEIAKHRDLELGLE
jgi:Rrf2 family protein